MTEHMSIEQLHMLVECGFWKSSKELQTEIYRKYLDLSLLTPFPNFGTPEFWASVFPTTVRNVRSTSAEPSGRSNSDPPLRKRRMSEPAVQYGYGVQTRRQAQLDAPGPSHSPSPPSKVRAVRSSSQPSGSEPPPKRRRCASDSDMKKRSGYTLTSVGDVRVKRFRTRGRYFEIELHDVDDPFTNIYNAFREAIDRAFKVGAGGLVGMEISHPGLHHPILVPFSEREKLTADNVINLLEAVMQSAEDVEIGSKMQVKVVMVTPPTGDAYVKGARLLGEKAPCITQIKNKKDKLCVARAIVYEMARIRQKDSIKARRYWLRIQKQDKCKEMRNAAKRLMAYAGIEEGTTCGIPELKKLQAVVPYQIKAWTLDLELFYEGKHKEKQICLLFVREHCNVIRSIRNFMSRTYYCHVYNKGYNNSTEHQRCSASCPHCFTVGSECKFERWRECKDCGRYFVSKRCLYNHKQLGNQEKSVCEKIKVCDECKKYVYAKREHRCGEFKCGACRTWDEPNFHQFRCFIQPLEDEDEPDRECAGYVFFDLETTVEEKVTDKTWKHVSNYCVVQKVCDSCSEGWTPKTKCNICNPKKKKKRGEAAPQEQEEAQRVFTGKDCLAEFAEWLLVPENQGRTVFAHNMKGFDGQFVLEYAINKGLKPSTIMRGLSILSMEIEKIRFLDSFCFMPMPLSALPSSFGFEHEVIKGWFPHKFNRTENQNYVGPYPSADNYCADQMKPKERSKFLTWHEAQKGKEFDFAKEMHRYCEDDVNILRRAVLEFRRIFIAQTALDPYENSITIASACMRVFRRQFLDEGTLGIIPHGGYRRKERQSVSAIQWLKWVSHIRGIKIAHAKNLGEAQSAPYKLDGYSPQTNTAFEFHGTTLFVFCS